MIKKHKSQSAAKWANEMGITVLNFAKAFTMEEYYDQLLNRTEFLNKISLCEIKQPEVKTRREMEKFRQQLSNKKNEQ